MQINRLFEMVYLLMNRQRITAEALAAHFEVSIRTIYRDVSLLSSAGIPIYMSKGKGGGISLLSDFVLDKAVLTDNERSDILSALQAMAAVGGQQANTAVKKLSSLFGSGNSDWIEIDFSGWANAEDEAALFALLKTGIIEKRQLTFFYHSNGSSEVRTVEPLKLCFKGQSWYLLAFCTLRQANRFFKLRRIKQAVLLPQHFERTAPPKVFDDLSQRTVFQDKMVTISLKLSKNAAYRVCDEFAEYQQLENGDFLVQFEMPQGSWVFQYLATFGADCEVLAPEEIRLEMKDKLEKMLQCYL